MRESPEETVRWAMLRERATYGDEAARILLKIKRRRDELRRMADERLKTVGQDGLTIQIESEAAELERLLREE